MSPKDRQQSKQAGIVQEVARRIREEIWPPGSRLPKRTELEKEFSCTTVTLQQAFNTLKLQGFVVSKGRWGTYVAKRPPCHHSYVLAFPSHPGHEQNWSRFYWALSQGAVALARDPGYTIRIYHDINPPLDSSACRQLESDIQSGSLAGVIFASSPHQLAGTPILFDDGIPRVGVMKDVLSGYPHLSAVYPDHPSFLKRAARRLSERGCRRVGVITAHKFGDPAIQLLLQSASEYGIEIQPRWVHGINPHDAQWVIHTLMLLMAAKPPDRPDGLIVTVDQAVPHIETAAARCDVDIPADLDVVAAANFPAEYECSTPILRLGFAAREILETCIQQLTAVRQKRQSPSLTRIQAMFEDEWYACYHPDQAVIGAAAIPPQMNAPAQF